MGIDKIMNKAVFLDRDGTINESALNKNTGEYESPHILEDFKLLPWAVNSMKILQDNGYLLFLVSNQPSFAKGKVTLEMTQLIHAKFHDLMKSSGIIFTEYYYCYHHPDGIVPEYTKKCSCRKPGTLFPETARTKYDIDMKKSWFVGDQDADVECGKATGLKTILLDNQLSAKKRGQSKPDYFVKDLAAAVDIIINEE